MGEELFNLILYYFGNAQNVAAEPERIVSATITNFSLMLAYFAITATLLWFTTKSVLMRRTQLLYLFAAFLFFSGMSHLGMLLGGYPLPLQLTIDFLAGVSAIATATGLFQKRHFVLSIVYQFKYVVGLLKTLERLDEVEGK